VITTYLAQVSTELEWTSETDPDSGVTSECARMEARLPEYRGGNFAYGGEGWATYEVDRTEAGEWVLVTDSGTMKDFLDEDDARGLMWIHVRRFRSLADRARWVEAAQRRQEEAFQRLLSSRGLPRRSDQV
jgi:hypothetical protein